MAQLTRTASYINAALAMRLLPLNTANHQSLVQPISSSLDSLLSATQGVNRCVQTVLVSDQPQYLLHSLRLVGGLVRSPLFECRLRKCTTITDKQTSVGAT